MDKVFTEKIREWLKKSIEHDNYKAHLLLAATHSHSTPQISGKIFNNAKPDPSYLSFLYDQVCQAISSALDNEEECYAKLSITYPGLTVNRRKKILSSGLLKRGTIKKIIANRPNYNGALDDKLYTIWFYNSRGKEKAVILNYACHPTLFRENAVSADFPGMVSSHLKSKVSEELVVCFLQGFTGNIKADLTRLSCYSYRRLIPYVYSCLFDRLQFNKNPSKELLKDFSAKLAKSSMLKSNSKYIDPQLFFHSKSIRLPLRDNTSSKYENFDILYISIGVKLKIIALGGEIFSEYSLWLRNLLLSRKIDLLTVGYCNDMTGYIPTYEAMLEGGYEVERTFKEFSHSAPFSDRIENVIKKEIEELIRMDLV